MYSINNYKLLIVFIAFQLLGFSSVIFAQKDNIELSNVDFVGNDFFDTAELEDLISSKESPSSISQFLYSFSIFGSPATYFDSLSVQDDINIL